MEILSESVTKRVNKILEIWEEEDHSTSLSESVSLLDPKWIDLDSALDVFASTPFFVTASAIRTWDTQKHSWLECVILSSNTYTHTVRIIADNSQATVDIKNVSRYDPAPAMRVWNTGESVLLEDNNQWGVWREGNITAINGKFFNVRLVGCTYSLNVLRKSLRPFGVSCTKDTFEETVTKKRGREEEEDQIFVNMTGLDQDFSHCWLECRVIDAKENRKTIQLIHNNKKYYGIPEHKLRTEFAQTKAWKVSDLVHVRQQIDGVVGWWEAKIVAKSDIPNHIAVDVDDLRLAAPIKTRKGERFIRYSPQLENDGNAFGKLVGNRFTKTARTGWNCCLRGKTELRVGKYEWSVKLGVSNQLSLGIVKCPEKMSFTDATKNIPLRYDVYCEDGTAEDIQNNDFDCLGPCGKFDVISIRLDVDNQTLTFRKNDDDWPLEPTFDHIGEGPWCPYFCVYAKNASFSIN